jgi:peptide/nickel transport system substrate-binding protein
VQFNLGQPTPVFPAVAAQDFNSYILDSKAIKAHSTKSDPYAHNWVTNHDIGTGPYTIQSWQPGQQITIVRYPDYWAGWSGKHFSKAIITTVPVASTRRELVEKGNADLTFDLTPQDVDALRANSKLRVTSPYASEIFYITMTQTGPLASPLARQALSYAVPYDAIIHGIYHDQAKRAYGPLPAAIEGYDPNAFHYQTDFAKAKALLQKAGVPQGTSLTYAYDSGAFPQDVVGNVLVAAFSQIGITLKLEGLSTTGFNNAAYGTESPSARPNLIGNTWWPDYNDPYDMADTLIDSKQAPPNGNNLGLYHDNKADAALALMNTSNISQILKASKTLQDITGRQDPPALWVAEPQQTVVLQRKLQGFTFNPFEIRTFGFYTMHY